MKGRELFYDYLPYMATRKPSKVHAKSIENLQLDIIENGHFQNIPKTTSTLEDDVNFGRRRQL